MLLFLSGQVVFYRKQYRDGLNMPCVRRYFFERVVASHIGRWIYVTFFGFVSVMVNLKKDIYIYINSITGHWSISWFKKGQISVSMGYNGAPTVIRIFGNILIQISQCVSCYAAKVKFGPLAFLLGLQPFRYFIMRKRALQ